MSDKPTRDEKLLGMTIVENREFELEGEMVTELIEQRGPFQYRVMWALSPFGQTVIDGIPNPIVSSEYTFNTLSDASGNYTSNEDYMKGVSRRRVEETMRELIKNPPMHLLPTAE